MAGSARQKIDPQIRDMFDLEVDKPDHDRILTTLFGDDGTLLRLLEELHGLEKLSPFTTESEFNVFSDQGLFKVISYDAAVEKTGITPTWERASPVRMSSKQLEVPMLWASERSSRIIGFCDIGISYQLVKWPELYATTRGEYSWRRNVVQRHALIEVKGAWPTVGNLVRQLNLYRHSRPVELTGHCQLLLVGPDASMNEIACQHQYRLATFDASGKTFTLQAGDSAPARTLTTEGVF
ncbi:hypothetical protein [Rhodoferax fermentans]|uniref:Uncharacterized protein n=1 Tax=Rhodoferax fermentans TaxID=28066 RepID=A0A1T1AWW9_RHOFE|nr:hypothetical protein [Rhodoferax fermentans]MBK1684844.1 hypothetical protein [Rhodoferax fermentans]OOV08458.1 hypothetical protein RF819_18715 [Rhodoferax fermentans]